MRGDLEDTRRPARSRIWHRAKRKLWRVARNSLRSAKIENNCKNYNEKFAKRKILCSGGSPRPGYPASLPARRIAFAPRAVSSFGLEPFTETKPAT